MKGRVYQVTDLGRGGKNGFMYVVSNLCISGKVHLRLVEDRDGGRFSHPTPCDGRCNKQVELDARAEALIAAFLNL